MKARRGKSGNDHTTPAFVVSSLSTDCTFGHRTDTLVTLLFFGLCSFLVAYDHSRIFSHSYSYTDILRSAWTISRG